MICYSVSKYHIRYDYVINGKYHIKDDIMGIT